MSRRKLNAVSLLIGVVLLLAFGGRYIANRYALYDYGPDALHHAIMLGNIKRVNTLLKLGASPNKKNEKGELPILLAIRASPANSSSVAALLLKHGADPNHLEYCLSEKKLGFANQLLRAGADPNQKLYGDEAILAVAARQSNEAFAELLIKFGAEVGPWEALHMRDARTLLRLLTENPAAIDANYVRGRTLLMATVLLDELELANQLLDRGADPNLGDGVSDTALHYAVAAPNGTEFIKLFLINGADPSIPGQHGRLPISRYWYKPADDFDIRIQLLLDGGTPVNAVDAAFRTPLFDVAAFGTPQQIVQMIRMGANPNHKDARNYTPIFSANAENVATLVAAGADPNVFSTNGETPLNIAVFGHRYSRTRQVHLEKIEALLAGGSQPNLAREGEKTVLEEAYERVNRSRGFAFISVRSSTQPEPANEQLQPSGGFASTSPRSSARPEQPFELPDTDQSPLAQAIRMMEASFQDSPESPVQP